ncbi:trans-aconitate 2-methyltransferase [Hymenobacter sp. BT730]|uniref:class I SAM-dependent methyltransferase n=1 Tax=Hymenobacter sp. BT730 TaxID=3063332 RepID=UPI0026DF5B88|nr:class I SAM-dependent methyltransferase [Hymenobacter sp. BT730]
MDHNAAAVALFDKLANQYQAKYMRQDQYHASFDAFCCRVAKPNPAILEIACGPGNITQYLLAQRPDFRLLGIDLAPNMLALARQNNPIAEFQLLDGRNIRQLGQQYDAIMCGFFLPYLSKEEAIKLIQDAAMLLTEDGTLYISTMEDEYSKSGLQYSSSGEPLYMYFHQADYLLAALTENGFRNIEVQRLTTSGQNGAVTTDLLILASK